MQAKLPDVNAAIVRHRSNAIVSLENKNYSMFIISWSAINALLPEDFKVQVNTQKYNELCTEKKTIECEFCTASPLLKDVKTYDLIQVPISSFVTDQEYVKVWVCGGCKKTNVYKPKNIKITKFQEPSYFKVIPTPPVKRGIQNRKNYDYEFYKWANIAFDEIESQIGIYRAEYAAQQETQLPLVNDGEF